MIKIAPSTNPEKEENLIEYVKSLEAAGADYLHCDVMDGKFVEATCLSSQKLLEVSQNSSILLDVHLMVANPIQVFENYLKAKPSIVTVHYESFSNAQNLVYMLQEIKKRKIMVGLSIKPQTKIRDIEPYLPLVDLVLIMSVEPGKSGQTFIDNSLNKIAELKNVCEAREYNIKIEVDGGITLNNVKAVADAGANIVVMGSAVYKAENKAEFLQNVRAKVNG
ncbi:MAG: ribulose-phosphate 3-epimerase [Clostridia bacterium]|nr:ribulose-phosphate 3-epimerase [Clostridia bacterium]